MFVSVHCFKIEMPTSELLAFLAHAPTEKFVLLTCADQGGRYGYFLSDELMEYFVNEYKIFTLEHVSEEELFKVFARATKVWGNR